MPDGEDPAGHRKLALFLRNAEAEHPRTEVSVKAPGKESFRGRPAVLSELLARGELNGFMPDETQ